MHKKLKKTPLPQRLPEAPPAATKNYFVSERKTVLPLKMMWSGVFFQAKIVAKQSFFMKSFVARARLLQIKIPAPEGWGIKLQSSQNTKHPLMLRHQNSAPRGAELTHRDSNRCRLFVWESRPRDEGCSMPARPAWRRQIFEPYLRPDKCDLSF